MKHGEARWSPAALHAKVEQVVLLDVAQPVHGVEALGLHDKCIMDGTMEAAVRAGVRSGCASREGAIPMPSCTNLPSSSCENLNLNRNKHEISIRK